MIWSHLFAAALFGIPSSAGGCLAVPGEHITAQDLVTAWEALRNIPGDTVFGYSPSPGARRIYYPPELARLAEHYQVAPPNSSICVERAMEVLNRDRLLAALHAALQLPEAQMELCDYSRYRAPRGELEFARSGLGAVPAGQPNAPVLWKGYVRYGDNRRFPVWARVRISAPMERVVAVVDLVAGQPVQTSQLRLETYAGSPLRRTEAVSFEQVVGQAPRRTVTAGSPVNLSALQEPHAVERGDEVAIDVETGAAHLAFTGRAESAGRRGQTVSVRNASSGKTFPARVSEKGRVTVTVKQPLDDQK